MTYDDACAIVRGLLVPLAPGPDLDAIDDDALLHEVLDLDSMDVVELVRALQAATGVELGPRDYPALASVGSLARHLASTGP